MDFVGKTKAAGERKCFWANSEVGKLAGGCKRGDSCIFKDSHE